MRESHEETFDEFAASAMPRLRRLAYAWCHDWYHSDDVLQDTMERVYAAWPRVRRGGEKYAFARTVLLRRLVSENRRAWRRREVSVAEDADFGDSLDPYASSRIERLNVLDVLNELPERQKAVAILRFLEDLSVSDVAELLHCSEGTVKSQAHHARQRSRLRQPETEGKLS